MSLQADDTEDERSDSCKQKILEELVSRNVLPVMAALTDHWSDDKMGGVFAHECEIRMRATSEERRRSRVPPWMEDSIAAKERTYAIGVALKTLID